MMNKCDYDDMVWENGKLTELLEWILEAEEAQDPRYRLDDVCDRIHSWITEH